MKITQSHLVYWQAKKAGLPKWASSLKLDNIPSIHALINSQAKETRDRYYVAHNTLAILASSRERGAMLDSLSLMAHSSPKRRAAYCQKWLARIKKENKGLLSSEEEARLSET